MSDYAMSMANASALASQRNDLAKMSVKLRTCGNYLLFRDYYTVGKVRLHAASFCKKHLLCPLCAIRRGAKMVKAYMDRLLVIQAANPSLKACAATGCRLREPPHESLADRPGAGTNRQLR
jgi:hypothetical protein